MLSKSLKRSCTKSSATAEKQARPLRMLFGFDAANSTYSPYRLAPLIRLRHVINLF